MTTNKLRLLATLIALVLTACSGQGFDAESEPFNNEGTNNGNNGGGDGPDNNGYIPEQELDFEFSAPAVVGEQVYVANETLNSVAVIDSRNLSISTRMVGFRPTKIVGPNAERAAVGEDASVMVLNEGSRSVSVLATDSGAVDNIKVMSQANAIAMDPTGTVSVVWYDPARAKATDPAGDLSSVSVVTGGESFEISVGFHVRDVFFDDAGEVALVLSDDGISQIDLTSLSGDAIAPARSVVPEDYETDHPEDLEVLVSSDAKWAITRSAGFQGAVLFEVDTGKHHFLALPETPTDIDLIESDQLEVLIMLRGAGKAVRATIPDGFTAAAEAIDLPSPTPSNAADAGSDTGSDTGIDAGSDTGLDAGGDIGSDVDAASYPDSGPADSGQPDTSQQPPFPFPTGIAGFEVIDVQVPGLGAASVSLDGQTALLFTTLGQETRAVLLDLDAPDSADPGTAEQAQRTLVFEKGVRGAISDSTGSAFLVIHSKIAGSIPPGATPADPEYIARSWGVSTVDVESTASRLVLTKHEPDQATLFTPDPFTPDQGDAKVYLIFKTPDTDAGVEPSHRDVLTINLRSFSTDSFRVPSLPDGLGPIQSAGRIYISQRHPQGRMTFVDVNSAARQTITGYQLNAGID
jgi:hypothetical protein